MAFGVPYVIILLLFCWVLFLAFYKSKTREIRITVAGKFRRNWKSMTASIVFGATILLWMTDFLHGMNAYVIALVPVVVYSATRIISVADLKTIDWDVLWLMAGGIALGFGLEKSGLITHIVKSIAFGSLSPLLIIFLVTVVTILIASFMSHTAAANLLLPVMAVLGTTVPSLASVGGAKAIILAATFASSLAMALPVSTPPNALAYATGEVKTKDMVKTGVPIGVFGLILIYVMLFILRRVHFL